MAWERRIMRTVRVRNDNKPGVLAGLMTAIAGMTASVGSIDLINETARSVVRDVTVYADDAEHMDKVIEAMRANPGTRPDRGARRSADVTHQRQDRHPFALPC